MKRFQKAGRGAAPQGRVPEPHCSLHAQGLKLICQTQGPEQTIKVFALKPKKSIYISLKQISTVRQQ